MADPVPPTDRVSPTTAIPVERPVRPAAAPPPETHVDVDVAALGGDHRARSVSWGAILAGTVLGIGIMILLSLIGIAIGLAVADPAEPGSNAASVGIGSAVWFVLSQLVALFVGGYAASRLSANLGKQKAWLHGATVWALATIGLVYLAVSGTTAVVSTGFSAIQSAGSGIVSAAQAVIPDDASLPSLGASDAVIANLPQPVQNALRERGLSTDQIKRQARQAYRSVVSEREQSQALGTAGDVARDIVRSPSDALSDIEDGIDRLVGQGGTFSEEDRQQFLTEVQNRFGINEQEAETFVANVEQQAKQAADTATQALETARREATQAAQAATEAVSTAALWASIASILGLLAAVFGAAAGRRDEPVEEDYRRV